MGAFARDAWTTEYPGTGVAFHCKFSLLCFSNLPVRKMIETITRDKASRLFIFFTAFFVANALIAECIGGKIFSLEKVFGLEPDRKSVV